MSFTSHGHHIDGTILLEAERPERVMRCGGPGMCGQCSLEASAVQKACVIPIEKPTVIIIKRHETDSWNAGPPVFLAAARDEEAAKRWIQDEVDHKHNNGHQYMQGKDADWWIKYGTFSLTTVEVVS